MTQPDRDSISDALTVIVRQAVMCYVDEPATNETLQKVSKELHEILLVRYGVSYRLRHLKFVTDVSRISIDLAVDYDLNDARRFAEIAARIDGSWSDEKVQLPVLDEIKSLFDGVTAPPNCPECSGETVRFRGTGLSAERWICPRYKEPGHLSSEELEQRIRDDRNSKMPPSGRFA